MNLLQQFKESAGKSILKKELRSHQRKPIAMGYSDALSIGILYDANQKENYEAVKNYVRRLRNDQKEIKSLGFINSKKLPGDQYIKLGMDFFTLTDINWHLRPVGVVTDNFVKENFDLLISLSMEDTLPLNYLTVYSKARFKIGKYSAQNENMFDFMINLDPKETIDGFIKQLDHFLLELNKR